MKTYTGDEALALSTKGRINVIYGYTGSGKTSLALSATKNNKVLFIDIENRMGKAWANLPDDQKNLKNLTTARLESIKELLDFLNSKESSLYNLVIIDSLTFLAEQELANITDQGRSLSFHDYGRLGEEIKQTLRKCQLKGLNVDFLMQAERVEGDGGGLIYFPRAAGKQIVPAVVERADNIIYIKNENKKRTGYTYPSSEWHAKRSDPIPETIEEENLYYSFVEKHFTKYKFKKADKKELLKLLKDAEVKDPKKLYDRIGWDGKSDLFEHQLKEANDLLQKQILANQIKKDESNKPS